MSTRTRLAERRQYAILACTARQRASAGEKADSHDLIGRYFSDGRDRAVGDGGGAPPPFGPMDIRSNHSIQPACGRPDDSSGSRAPPVPSPPLGRGGAFLSRLREWLTSLRRRPTT